MDNLLVSIIVPVYNVEKYLCKCLDSIINQTYQNLEIILVDDESKDTSGQICDEYASKDSRIIVIHKENGGVSSARNRGLDIAKGNWVLFVDADDIIPLDALSFYFEVISTNDVDMVLGGYVECDEEGTILKSNQKQFQKLLSMLDCLKLFYKSDTVLFQGYVWNRLMKLSIIQENHIRYNESIYFKEDGLFAVQYMVSSTLPCYYSSQIVYNYYIHSNSSMRVYNSNLDHKYLTNLDARILCLKSIEKNYNDVQLIHLAKYSVLHFYNRRLSSTQNDLIQNLKIPFLLLYKGGFDLSWTYFKKFKLVAIKGDVYCLLRDWKNKWKSLLKKYN